MKPSRKIEKPSSGTIMAAKARAICSAHTKQQRADYIARGMRMFYAHAQPAGRNVADEHSTNDFLTTHGHALAASLSR